MRVVIVWEREVTSDAEGLEVYFTKLAGHSCLVTKAEEKEKWRWSVSAELPDGESDQRLTGGEEETLAKAMLASVKELKKITRRTFRDLRGLHGAKTVDMKVLKPRTPPEPAPEPGAVDN